MLALAPLAVPIPGSTREPQSFEKDLHAPFTKLSAYECGAYQRHQLAVSAPEVRISSG